MQKIINDPNAFVDEMLEGVLLAHPEDLRRAQDPRVVVRADAPRPGKVGIVTGGGSGHLPVFLGYVGYGLADGVAVGNVFASPSSEQILEATREVHGGAGVLYLYGNYSGDVMNFDLSAELAEAEGIEVATVLAADDVASAPRGSELRRRGSQASLCSTKWLGRGRRRGRRWPRWWRPPTLPLPGCAPWVWPSRPACCRQRGNPPSTFRRGRWRSAWGSTVSRACEGDALEPAERIAEQLLAHIIEDLPYRRGDEVAVLVNGLGATPKEELYILFRSVREILASSGIAVRRTWVGEYATSLEMAGASVSLLRLDDELAELLDAPCESPFVIRRGAQRSIVRKAEDESCEHRARGVLGGRGRCRGLLDGRAEPPGRLCW